MSDIQNDTDLKPSDHILDDWLTEHGMAVTFDDARKFLGDLREAFGREDSAPRPVIDREAVKRVVLDHVWHSDKCPCGDAEGRHAQHLTDELMKLARPMPTRHQIETTLRNRLVKSNFNDHLHEPVRTQTIDAWVDVLAGAMVLLLNGSES